MTLSISLTYLRTLWSLSIQLFIFYLMSSVAAAVAADVKEEEHQAEHYYKGYDPVKDE